MKTCADCHGSGHCEHCSGRGHRGLTQYFSESHRGGQVMFCLYCAPAGSGRCATCLGMGLVEEELVVEAG